MRAFDQNPGIAKVGLNLLSLKLHLFAAMKIFLLCSLPNRKIVDDWIRTRPTFPQSRHKSWQIQVVRSDEALDMIMDKILTTLS